MSSSSIFLDVDPSIVENNLRFMGDGSKETITIDSPNYPSKLVLPLPGFCIKAKETGTNAKVFINICHCDDIPCPEEISEAELKKKVDNQEVIHYRLPMSIGQLRDTQDNKGQGAKVCDIAMSTKFFKKLEKEEYFKSFAIIVAIQALTEKYGLSLEDDKIILQNKRSYGTLQQHRLQNREMGAKMGFPDRRTVDEMTASKKPVIETLSSQDFGVRIPEYRLYKRKSKPNVLVGEFKLPDIISAQEMTLDIGEDRIVLESKSKNYLLDICVPYILRQNSCSSCFEKSSKLLTITMPLAGG